eukprot:scaffold2055_cov30-Tisochrysis_lutea.AAC.2
MAMRRNVEKICFAAVTDPQPAAGGAAVASTAPSTAPARLRSLMAKLLDPEAPAQVRRAPALLGLAAGMQSSRASHL